MLFYTMCVGPLIHNELITSQCSAIPVMIMRSHEQNTHGMLLHYKQPTIYKLYDCGIFNSEGTVLL